MTDRSTIAPSFIEMAHRIVVHGRHDRHHGPATHPRPPPDLGVGRHGPHRLDCHQPYVTKADHLAAHPVLSLTYWAPNHDTCTADCSAAFETDSDARHRTWDRFAHGPAPVGYDPTIVPGWDNADSPRFGSLRLEPRRLRVMPGTVMLSGTDQLLTWRR